MDAEKPSNKCGRLRYWTIVLGILFFALAAVCEFEAAYTTYSSGVRFRQFLSQQSVTAEAIQASVAGMGQSRGVTDWCFHAGLGFMMLGFACVVIGGRCGCSCRRGGDEA